MTAIKHAGRDSGRMPQPFSPNPINTLLENNYYALIVTGQTAVRYKSLFFLARISIDDDILKKVQSLRSLKRRQTLFFLKWFLSKYYWDLEKYYTKSSTILSSCIIDLSPNDTFLTAIAYIYHTYKRALFLMCGWILHVITLIKSAPKKEQNNQNE